MGAQGLTDAAVDAGPLIHLGEIGGIAFLRVFRLLHVPEAVWAETVGRDRVQEADLLSLTHLQRRVVVQEKVTRFVTENNLGHLHAGEEESLYLCYSDRLLLLLTDDLAVREAAKHRGITPVGSLGVVVRAYRTGQISVSEAERFLNDLYDSSTLFVTRTIVDLAMEQLRR
ncbi:MAG: hypothetical protein ACR2GR_06165 [Rhodothermales bacterium]